MQYTLNKHGPRDGPFFSYQLSAVSYQKVKSIQHSAFSIQWFTNHNDAPALRFASSISDPELVEGQGFRVSEYQSLTTQYSLLSTALRAPRSAFVSPSPPLPLTHSWKSFPWQIEIADGYSLTSHLEYPGRNDNDRLSRPPGNVMQDGESRNEFRESGEICLSHSALRTPHSEGKKFEGLRFLEVKCKELSINYFTPSLLHSLAPSLSCQLSAVSYQWVKRIPHSALRGILLFIMALNSEPRTLRCASLTQGKPRTQNPEPNPEPRTTGGLRSALCSMPYANTKFKNKTALRFALCAPRFASEPRTQNPEP